mmetsp:Transcript_13494/g.28135  ORF Transcript_13494/g.28135 Transcript_13494/m.28135 type:complete len:159 (+) Transcript_13494:106-582(+)
METKAKIEADEKLDEPEKTGPEYVGCAKGKYKWGKDVPNKQGADDDVSGDIITKYGWADGKKTVSIYVELDGLDAVPDDAITVESSARDVSLRIKAVGTPPRTKRFKLVNLANEIEGVKLVRKSGKNTVTLRLSKKEEKSWWKLEANSASGFGGHGSK